MESHTHRLTVANCIKFVSQTLYFSGPAAAHGMEFITQTLYFSGPAAAHGMKFITQPLYFSGPAAANGLKFITQPSNFRKLRSATRAPSQAENTYAGNDKRA